MSQIARNLTDDDEGMVRGKGYLIHDRDPLFTPSLSRCWQVGVKTVKLPPRSPNLNAYAERFVRSIKESCLERLILIGEKSLRTAVQSFLAHCHSERNHQGLANRLICPEVDNLVNTGVVQRRKLLVVRKNTFGNQTGRCLLSLTTRKAENVDPSASSIPLRPEDTPALAKDGLHLLPCPPVSGSDLLQPILMMKTTQNRLGVHSISRGNLMSLFLQRHRQAISRLWKFWAQARMGPCLTKWVFHSFRIPLR